MISKAFYCSLWLSAFVLLSGCGHDGLIEGDLSTGGTERSTITGGVLAPGSTLAANASLLDRFASLLFPSALALSGNVQPIGLGELVSLDRVTASDAADGFISENRPISDDRTNDGGRFTVPLVDGAEVGQCGLMLRVGLESKGTLTRALVYSQIDQDVSAVSEAVVRRILVYLASNPGSSLCAFSTDEIAGITSLVGEIASAIGGTSVADINANVEVVAANSADVNAAIAAAGSS